MNLGTYLDKAVERYGDRILLAFYDQEITYRDFGERVNRLANGLRSLGLKKGDFIHVLMSNSPEVLVSYFAIQKIGAVAGPINTFWKEKEVTYLLNDSKGVALIVEHSFVPMVQAIRRHCPHLKHVIEVGDDVDTENHSFHRLIEQAVASPVVCQAAEADPCYIFYTSGTTGNPKGVLLSHRNVLVDMDGITQALDLDEGMVILIFLPLFHVNAMLTTNFSLERGFTVVLRKGFSASEFWEVVSRHKVNFWSAVPAVYQILLSDPDSANYDLSSLQFGICGAAPLTEDTMRRFEGRFKIPIIEGYGLTEGTCVSTINPRHGKRKVGSIGLSIPHQEVKIVRPDGSECEPMERGEIVIRGENVMLGYYNRPQATAETLRDGWLHTGDVGYKDEEGYIFIVDRIKDMIIRGGENIYPKEIDNFLATHPKIREAATIGVPDKIRGEEVKTYVVPADPSLTVDEVIAYCQDNIAAYKVPRYVEIVKGDLPRNPVGKVLKKELRRMSITDAKEGVGSARADESADKANVAPASESPSPSAEPQEEAEEQPPSPFEASEAERIADDSLATTEEEPKDDAGLTVTRIFRELPARVIKEAIAGIAVRYGYRITGEQASEWTVLIKDGVLTVEPGLHEPDVTVTMEDCDFIALNRGQLDGMTFFNQGKLKATGNVMLLMRMSTFFKPMSGNVGDAAGEADKAAEPAVEEPAESDPKRSDRGGAEASELSSASDMSQTKEPRDTAQAQKDESPSPAKDAHPPKASGLSSASDMSQAQTEDTAQKDDDTGDTDIEARIEALFSSLPQRLNVSKIQGLSVRMGYDLTGPAACQKTVIIDKGTVKVVPGLQEPEVTVMMQTSDFYDLNLGKLDGMTAFTAGKLKVRGNMGLLMKSAKFFKPYSPKEEPGNAEEKEKTAQKTSSEAEKSVVPTAADIIASMPERANVAAIADVSARLGYSLSGAGGGEWTVLIDKGQVRIREGLEKPQVTATMSAQDFVLLNIGKLDGMTAFTSGRLKVKGDTGLLTKSARFFKKYSAPGAEKKTKPKELLVLKKTISIPQRFATGPLMGKFLRELRDNKRIIGNRCPSCGRIQTPPREICALCRVRVTELVEIGPQGTVGNYDVTYYASPDPLTGESRETPYCAAFILLDGCSGNDVFWHEIKPEDIPKLRKGVRVKPVWAEQRTGAITDIKYFEIIG